MALELIAGTVFSAAVAELLKAVTDAKKKVTSFQTVLTGIESTLKSVIPRVNEIKLLNRKLNIPDEEMEQLITVLHNGLALVHKCSKISTLNIVKKGQYSKKLDDLDYSLMRYFQTILPLDHYRDGKEMLLMTRELHMRVVGDNKDEGESSNSQVSEIQPCKDSNKNKSLKPLVKVGDIKFQLRLTPQAKRLSPSVKIGPLKLSI